MKGPQFTFHSTALIVNIKLLQAHEYLAQIPSIVLFSRLLIKKMGNLNSLT